MMVNLRLYLDGVFLVWKAKFFSSSSSSFTFFPSILFCLTFLLLQVLTCSPWKLTDETFSAQVNKEAAETERQKIGQKRRLEMKQNEREKTNYLVPLYLEFYLFSLSTFTGCESSSHLNLNLNNSSMVKRAKKASRIVQLATSTRKM